MNINQYEFKKTQAYMDFIQDKSPINYTGKILKNPGEDLYSRDYDEYMDIIPVNEREKSIDFTLKIKNHHAFTKDNSIIVFKQYRVYSYTFNTFNLECRIVGNISEKGKEIIRNRFVEYMAQNNIPKELNSMEFLINLEEPYISVELKSIRDPRDKKLNSVYLDNHGEYYVLLRYIYKDYIGNVIDLPDAIDLSDRNFSVSHYRDYGEITINNNVRLNKKQPLIQPDVVITKSICFNPYPTYVSGTPESDIIQHLDNFMSVFSINLRKKNNN